MLLISVLIAPLMMLAALSVERRLGPAAAGWVAALPTSFTIAVITVEFDAGGRQAADMALSAGSHVPALLLFAVAAAGVLRRRASAAAMATGTLAYALCAFGIALVPQALAVALAVPALALAPRLITATDAHVPAAGNRRSGTAAMCAASAVVVAAAVLTARFAGPGAAGAIAAFPTMSSTLAVAVTVRYGAPAGRHALLGLVRSLPCYLTFCLAIGFAMPRVGALAVPIAVLASLAVAALTWRGVPVLRGSGSRTAEATDPAMV